MSNFTLAATVQSALPAHPYERMKDEVLGKRYTLSLVFVGERRARSLNYAYRKKTYVPNVLSFPLDADTGEIFIVPAVAAREAAKFAMTPKGYIAYLFIHGLLHLKGLDHGAQMDREESRLVKKYNLK